jgi:Na+/proline symporter
MFFGVLFIYVIYFTGKENLWIKGIGFGMLVWVSIFGVLLQQLIQGKIPPEPSGILVTVVAHFIFGLSLGIFTKLLAGNLATYEEEANQPAESKKNNQLSLRPMRKLEIKKPRFKKPEKI